jgi:hypothetical protein
VVKAPQVLPVRLKSREGQLYVIVDKECQQKLGAAASKIRANRELERQTEQSPLEISNLMHLDAIVAVPSAPPMLKAS